jgi:hypothetical protein
MSIRDSATYAVAEILGFDRGQLSRRAEVMAVAKMLLLALKLTLARLLGVA